MRYRVIGYRDTGGGWPVRTATTVVEEAKTREDANVLFDIMLEDESMIGEVKVLDTASDRYVRNSMNSDDAPL
jgi:hypothetical protein